ncbi:hypothetical protein PF004_g2976 [Phytophthora fragariae]|uniref:Ubiquitin-like protease family profile domain-containing protein n=1 Tax=Phytophthora fragariae TaxID=53985 RepID=A0A6G0PMW0_9STRA|nr:hypothetical protein PF004_g2976 [Phytophthora fragariae]
MSELSKGGTDEDREQGDMLLEGRDRLAELRERRRDLENGSGQRGMSSGESERLQQETQAAAFDLAHEAMSAEAVKAFVKLKRAEYAAKHAPLVAPTGAGMVARPPGRACRPERFADLVADNYDSPSTEDSEFASEVAGERSDSGTDAARHCFGLSDSTGEASDAEESTADGMHEEGARTPDVNACTGVLLGFPSRWWSWKRFHNALETFSAKTKQRFVVRSSQTVPKRNRQMSSKDGHYPRSWKHYSKTLICTHGNKLRSRSSGARQHRTVRYTGCTAKVHALLGRLGKRYYIHVRSSGCHNHNVDGNVWNYYAENRTIHDPAILATVSDMASAGATPKGILAWLRKKKGKKTKLKDVHNMLQDLKKADKQNMSDVERTESILEEFTSEHEGNTAQIFVDKARGVAVAVTLQSAGMKRLFAAFPEVLMVDSTHDTNCNGYKLFSFVVHDCFGKGQYVHHALVERETKDNLRLAVNAFKACNPQFNEVKVVMTDKAFHGKDILAEVFTRARQLLCQFHVQQWFSKQYALSSDANYVIEGAGEDAKLRSLRSDQVHTLNTKTYKCDCTFAQTLLLPCRHAMFYRKTNGNESVLPPFSLLCPRWLRAHRLNDIREGPVNTGEFEYHIIDSAESVAPVVAPVKKDVKYSQAKQLTDELLSLLSNQPTPTFQAAMRWLRGFTKSVHDGELENFAGFVPDAAADLDKVLPSASVAIAAPTQIVVPASEDMDLEEKAPATAVVQSHDDITARKPPNYTFTKPVKNKKMSKKAHSKIARLQRKMVLRNLANLCEGGVPSSTPSASDIDNLLSTNYSYHSVAPALEKYDLPACDVAEDAGLRLLREDQYVATWKEFGAATHEQLLFIERYVAAKNQLSTVDHTAEWVEDVSWSPVDIEAVPVMFWAPLQEKREIMQQQVRDLPLQLSVIGGEAIDGHSLLSFRRSQWLSTTAILVVMKALALKYHDVGVASPSFLEPKAPDRKRVVANAYKAFSPVKGEIIGALNFGSAHWVAFHINVKSRQCRLFDPQQGAKNYVKLKKSLSEVVEPLLPMDTKLMYFKYVSCVQQDSDNCGIWRLVMLELTLAKEKWHKELYKLAPYLRLRYLNLSLDYINDRRLEGN